jgi:hypothetical protein
MPSVQDFYHGAQSLEVDSPGNGPNADSRSAEELIMTPTLPVVPRLAKTITQAYTYLAVAGSPNRNEKGGRPANALLAWAFLMPGGWWLCPCGAPCEIGVK